METELTTQKITKKTMCMGLWLNESLLFLTIRLSCLVKLYPFLNLDDKILLP